MRVVADDRELELAELGEFEPGGTLARCDDQPHAVINIAIEIKCSAE
jgi:hypothetical protein